MLLRDDGKPLKPSKSTHVVLSSHEDASLEDQLVNTKSHDGLEGDIDQATRLAC